MRERFENRNINGVINIKMDDAKGTWVGDKNLIVNSIVSIAREYASQNYVLTLRQLYYQLVARDIIPNHDKVYAKISSIKDDCVYSGLVDWDVFEDRGRVPHQSYYEEDVKGALQRTINRYRLDRQEGQRIHIEVWTEKDAISSILRRATDPFTIRLAVNKGYTSSTAIHVAYERFVEEIADGKKVKILYFGDHDPSGMDMIRDINDRIMFMLTRGQQLEGELDDRIEKWWSDNEYNIWTIAQMEGYDRVGKLAEDDDEKAGELFEQGRLKLFVEENELFEIIPVGLTMEQIKKYNPPHNPAKITDPRAKGYIQQYGAVSWEVDALPPAIMLEIVREAIDEHMDKDVYNALMEREKEEKEKIIKMIDTLDED